VTVGKFPHWVAIAPDGNTAYVTIMGFTGGAGHVWKTTNAGTTWTDFSGTDATSLPDAPVNAVVVDATASIVYVGTDVGVFQSSTASPSWSEVGPTANSGSTGFLPNVAVTALSLFSFGGQKLLRASTYGRGIWQFNLAADFQVAISNTPQTIFSGQTATFNGTVTALNGYSSPISLSCISGGTSTPSPCAVSPQVLTATTNTPFAVTAGGSVGDYSFNVQGTGSDPNTLTHKVAATLHIVSFGMTAPNPSTVTAASGTASSPVSFQVVAGGSFNQNVTISCGLAIAGAVCNLTPAATVTPTASAPVNMSASVTVPPGTATGNYTVNLQATTAGAPASVTTSFTLQVSANPDFTFPPPPTFPTVDAGSTTTSGAITVNAVNGFTGTVSLSCSLVSGNGSCSPNPASVNSYPATVNVTVNASNLGAGSYQLSVLGTSGSITHSATVPFSVADFQLSGTQSLTLVPGGQGTASFTITPSSSYSGKINATCNAGALAGATCTVSPANPVPVTSGSPVTLTATITAPANAAAGNYNVLVNTVDTSGEPVHNSGVSLTVQDFAVKSSTSSQTVAAGQTSAPYSLTVAPAGASFSSAVTLSCSAGLPTGGLCSFTPNPLTPGSSATSVAMTIATGSSTPTGNYTITVAGTSGSLSHSLTTGLVVTGSANNSFQLAVSQAFPATLDAGSQATAQVAVTANYSGKVNVSCDASAFSGQCAVSPANPVSISSSSATALSVRINVPNSAAPNPSNPYNLSLTVTDSSGQPTQTLPVPLTVIQDFSVSSSTPSQSVKAGQTTGAYQVTVGPNPVASSFQNTVTLACTAGLPSGARCNFTPNPIQPVGNAPNVVMSISTISASRAQTAAANPRKFLEYALWFGVPGIVVLARRPRRPPWKPWIRQVLVLAMLGLISVSLPSCGGGTGSSGGGGGGGGGGNPTAYVVTVTGTSGSLTHSTTVQLLVSP
jgi:hypothetical protein